MNCNYPYPCNYAVSMQRCEAAATYIILWGCLEHHLQEFVVCGKHLTEWLHDRSNGEINCAYCHGKAEAFLYEELNKINPKANLHI